MPAGALQRARRLRAVGPTFFRLDYSGYYGYVLLDLTELSSYLPLVSSFEFGNASGKLFPCTEGRVRTIMVPPGTPRAGAFGVVDSSTKRRWHDHRPASQTGQGGAFSCSAGNRRPPPLSRPGQLRVEGSPLSRGRRDHTRLVCKNLEHLECTH